MPRAQTLEMAGAAVAAADRELIEAAERWRSVMVDRLDDLSAALAEHTAEAEGPDGILNAVLVDAPRLARETDRLRAQHRDLAVQIAETRANAQEPALGQNPPRVKALHAAVHDLITLLDGHCHRSVRLLQDSVAVDLGGPVG